MDKFIIFVTNHWIISHRRDSRYPGFLIVSSRDEVQDLTDLNKEALNELGSVLFQTEKLLNYVYKHYKTVIGKFGFTSGFSLHFHVLPITNEILKEIIAHGNYKQEKPDGIDAINLVCRKYCERELNDSETRSIESTVKMLKAAYNNKKQ
jgi:diadenosine tetraphosphate (Ap4A) HIT family hydrolase